MTSPADDAAGASFVAALIEDDVEELYESAPCAYLSTAPDGTIVKANRTFFSWTGHDRDELIGRRRWQDLLAIGDRIFYETHLAPVMQMQGMTREIALTIVTASGERLPVLANAVMKADEHGAPKVLRIVLFDARERRAYESELLAERRRAEASEARAANLARTLQASLLPQSQITIPDLDVGAAYRPAGDGSEVGGDFYDAVEMSTDHWALILGDVCGKGAAAAVITSLARDTMRREVLQTDRPAEVLGAVRDVMLRYHPDEFVTAVMLAVSPAGDGTFAVCSAVGGHPLPLVWRREGHFERLGKPGTILGMIAGGEVHEHDAILHPGDVLVLYTDGLTEARHDGEFFDDAGVEASLARILDPAVQPVASAQQIADGLITSALDFQAGNAVDDMAIMVLRIP